MNLIRRRNEGYWLDPFRELDRFQRDLGTLFETLIPARDGQQNALEHVWAPIVDVSEDENEFLIKADLPGLDKKDIQVSVTNGVLTIRGEKKHESDSRKKGVIRSERYHGTFHREIALPSEVDETKTVAEYKDGVLSLKLPKKEEAKPKQIRIDVK